MTHKITCKEDLYNTYIRCSEENNKAIIAKCKEFGIPVFESYASDVIDFGIFEICDGYNNSFMKLWLCWGEDDLDPDSVEITLEDLLGTAEDAVEETVDDPLPPQTFKKDGFTYNIVPQGAVSPQFKAQMFIDKELFTVDGKEFQTLSQLAEDIAYTREKLNWWDTCTFPVLCSTDGDILVVDAYDYEEEMFESNENAYYKVTPLTKEEIRVYLNNAPE